MKESNKIPKIKEITPEELKFLIKTVTSSNDLNASDWMKSFILASVDNAFV